jgi:hypothetical protein
MNKRAITIVVLIFATLLGIIGTYYSIYRKYHFIQEPQTTSNDYQSTGISSIPNAINPVIEGWITYVNTKYHYAIDYPQDWVFRESPDTMTGAGFRPTKSPGKSIFDIVSSEEITIYETGRAEFGDCNIPFPEYVKVVAIHNIQNYDQLNSIKPIVTQNGIKGYVTTWKIRGSAGNNIPTPTPPLAYFEDATQKCGVGTGIVAIVLNSDSNNHLKSPGSLTIYDQMLSSFRFMK